MFEIGRTYVRKQLHDQHGGQRQGGISTPADEPIVLIFTGAGGAQWGYSDGWEPDGTFRYSGEGQFGNMEFRAGNSAIRDHADRGRDLHLFETDGRGHARYIGQMVCAGYEVVPNIPDGHGNPRTAIVFRLVPLEDLGGSKPEPMIAEPIGSRRPSWYWSTDIGQLRDVAMEATAEASDARDARRRVQHRSEAVKVYVQRRAGGVCEACGVEAPFVTSAGRPYLEPHHTRRLSDGGPDHPAWVVALCPTCHRRAHHARDAKSFNESLVTMANQRELGRG